MKNWITRGVLESKTRFIGLGACLFACFSPLSDVLAKELYLATNGSDSVSYSQNAIDKPWKTLNHALYNIKAGDTLYIRGGNYSPQYPIWLHSTYRSQTYGGHPTKEMNAESGTSSKPVVIQSYGSETPVFNLQNISDCTFIRLDSKSYWSFKGLTFTNTCQVFEIGETFESSYNSFENLNITANRGGDNKAAIHVWGRLGDHVKIVDNVIRGPGQNVHLNTNLIYVKNVNNVEIKGNHLTNAPIGIYYKHVNKDASANDVNIKVSYNFIDNTSRASMDWNGRYADINNNVFGKNTAPLQINSANGGPGGDYNTISHNTFYGGGVNLGGQTQSGDAIPGAIGNTLSYNIFTSAVNIHLYTNLPHGTTLTGNMYPSSNSVFEFSHGNTADSGTGAYFGAPTFSSAQPSSIADFQLSSNSLGVSGVDGKAVGADIQGFLGNEQSEQNTPEEAEGNQNAGSGNSSNTSTNECDNWQTTHTEWLWCDSFEDGDLNSRYEDIGLTNFNVTSEDAMDGGSSLKQHYDLGQEEAGWIAKVSTEGFPDHIFYRYYHKYGYGMSSFPPKMSRLTSRDRSNWTTNIMIHNWMAGDFLSIDSWVPLNEDSEWLPVDVGDFNFRTNGFDWVAIEVEVKLNDPGQSNGLYRMWINGELEVDASGINLRGDSDVKINEVMIDNYWNSGAPEDSARYFDNFVISTSRIGMIGEEFVKAKASPPPSFGAQVISN